MRQHQTLLKPWIERHPKAQGLILTALDPEKPVVIKTCNTTGVGNNCQKTEYKVDEGPWKKYTDERTTLRGNIIQVRRKNCTNGKEIIENETAYTNCISIQPECGQFKLSGYIGSILDWEKNIFDTLEYPKECFMNFISDSSLKNNNDANYASETVGYKTIPVVDISELKLPDIVTEKMYFEAFNKCGYLTKIMDLNVDELASNCYNSMFQWCINLEYPMENLPATKLAKSCYFAMFRYCIKLKKIPNIIAELGADFACQRMFSCCCALKDISNFKVNINAISNGIFYNMFDHCISLEKGIDLSATTTFIEGGGKYCYYGMYSYCTSLKDPGKLPETLTLNNKDAGNGGTYQTEQIVGLFWKMYECCYMLETPPKLPHFINSSIYANQDEITGVQVFDSMFLNCHNLKSFPDLSNVNITGGLNLCAEMCSGCLSITEVPDNYLSTFGNHLGDYMFYRMFKDCIGLKKIGKIFGDNRIFKDPGDHNSHGKTWYPTMHSAFKEMFYNCQSLEEMPTENWLTINPANYNYPGTRAFGYMFKDCKKLKSAQGIKIYCDSTEVVYADCAFMFAGCSELKSIDITIDFYPYSVEGDYTNSEYAAFYHMFEGCTNLTTLPDRNWLIIHRPQQYAYKDINDVSTGEYKSCANSSDAFNNMFKDCTSIKSIHGIVYENALDYRLFYGMCENCTSLESFDIDLSNIDITYVTGKFNDVTNVQRSAYSMYKKMFYNCSKLTSVCELPMRNLGYRVIDTEGNVTNRYDAGKNSGMCYQMFYGCSSIETINFCMQNIKEFNSDTSNTSSTPNIYNGGEFYGMFEGCTSLKTTNLDLSTVEVCRRASSLFERMFYNCKNLTTIPNFSFDASLFTKVYNSYYTYRDMFYGCDALGDKLLEIKLPAINVVYNTSSSYYGRNYERMFANVSTLDLSVVQTDVYNTPYRIPDTGTLRYGGSGYEKELSADKSYMYTTDMFSGTKGTMNGTPELYTTYYYKGPGSDSGGDSSGSYPYGTEETNYNIILDKSCGELGKTYQFYAWKLTGVGIIEHTTLRKKIKSTQLVVGYGDISYQCTPFNITDNTGNTVSVWYYDTNKLTRTNVISVKDCYTVNNDILSITTPNEMFNKIYEDNTEEGAGSYIWYEIERIPMSDLILYTTELPDAINSSGNATEKELKPYIYGSSDYTNNNTIYKFNENWDVEEIHYSYDYASPYLYTNLSLNEKYIPTFGAANFNSANALRILGSNGYYVTDKGYVKYSNRPDNLTDTIWNSALIYATDKTTYYASDLNSYITEYYNVKDNYPIAAYNLNSDKTYSTEYGNSQYPIDTYFDINLFTGTNAYKIHNTNMIYNYTKNVGYPTIKTIPDNINMENLDLTIQNTMFSKLKESTSNIVAFYIKDSSGKMKLLSDVKITSDYSYTYVSPMYNYSTHNIKLNNNFEAELTYGFNTGVFDLANFANITSDKKTVYNYYGYYAMQNVSDNNISSAGYSETYGYYDSSKPSIGLMRDESLDTTEILSGIAVTGITDSVKTTDYSNQYTYYAKEGTKEAIYTAINATDFTDIYI